MNGFYRIEPEVAGGWGSGTNFSRQLGYPVVVNKLHYELGGWLGDDLLESSSCFVCTERLATALVNAKFTGFALDQVTISKSEQFEEIYPGRDLPRFLWLKVGGIPQRDDFGLSEQLDLIVSTRALRVLQSFQLSHATISDVS